MEIVSFFTDQKETVNLFDNFIYSYPVIHLVRKDHNTAYFDGEDKLGFILYYHYLLSDVEYEFSYNYSESDIKFIKEYFKNNDLFLFNMSYRNETFLMNMFRDFKNFLFVRDKEKIRNVLIDHPFNRQIKLQDI